MLLTKVTFTVPQINIGEQAAMHVYRSVLLGIPDEGKHMVQRTPVSQNLSIWARIDTQKPIILRSYVPYSERIFHSQINYKMLLLTHIDKLDQLGPIGVFVGP